MRLRLGRPHRPPVRGRARWVGSKATANATPTPTVVTVVAQVPAPTVTGAATATPTVVTVVASVGAPTVNAFTGRYPVSVSGRNILDQTGAPWPLIGDAGWSAIVSLTAAQQATYLDRLQVYGVNAVMVELIENEFSHNPPQNTDGNGPYSGTMFQSSTVEAYWARVDGYFALAAARGITVLACPAYLGYNDAEGVAAELAAASDAQAQAYGDFLGQRYKSLPGIIWVMGGDRAAPSATLLSRTDKIVTGLKAAGDTHLVTAHPGRGQTADAVYGAYSWLDVNVSYTPSASTFGNTVTDNATAYADTPTRPFFNIEGWYENDHSMTRAQLRYQAWASVCTGGIGHVYGNNPRWYFNDWSGGVASPTWRQTLGFDTPGTYDDGTVDLSVFAAWMNGRAAELLTTTPDTTDTFLTVGESSGSTQAAGRFSTTRAVIYMPTSREITLDMSELSGAGGTVRIRRFDPVSGSFSGLDSTYSAAGNLTFTTAAFGINSSGSDSDWVLLFEPAIVPAAVTVVANVPSPTISTAANQTVTPAAVTIVASVPSPTVVVSRTATPTIITVVASVSAPTIAVDRTAAPTAVTVVASVGAPTVAIDRTATPTTITVVASVPSPTIAIDRTTAPSAVTVVASVPAPAIQAGGSATASPSVVTIVTSVPVPSIFTGTSATATPSVVTVVALVPALSITTTGNATATPSTVTVVVQVGAAVITIDRAAAPSVVTVLALPAAPGVSAAATAAAMVVTVLCLVGSPTILGAVSNVPVTSVRLVLGLDRRIRLHPDPRITWRR